MTSSPWNKLVKYVSPPNWNCVELAQLDMPSQLKLPQPLWHPWFCHASITAIPCCQGFLNSWLTNFKRFKIVLLDSISKCPKAHMFHHFWLNCTGFQPLRESITKFPLCAMMLSQILPPSTCLISFAFTSRPVPFTSFLCWHPHLSDSNTKEKIPRAACFLPSRPCHLEQTPLLWTSCSNTIPVQSSTKNHTIPLSVRTRLLELLCVFNCSPYFSSCKTACDLHLCVSE